MAQAADFVIVSDPWVVQGVQDTINFSVPSNIDPRSRSVIGFLLEVDNADDTTMTLRMNGTKIWHWTYGDGARVQFFQEVLNAGVVKAGANVFSFDSSSGDFRFVQLSDIVVWFRVNISTFPAAVA